jgi:hypothetical protein
MNTTQSSAQMMAFHVPGDARILESLGRIALRHAHLDHILRMTIKTLGEVSVREGLDPTSFEGSRVLRERIRKIARNKLGEGTALIKLQAQLERARRATENRNELIHNIWAQPLDGEPQIRTNDHTWKPIPTIDALNALENEIASITEELNDGRLDGFLSEALDRA